MVPNFYNLLVSVIEQAIFQQLESIKSDNTWEVNASKEEPLLNWHFSFLMIDEMAIFISRYYWFFPNNRNNVGNKSRNVTLT